MPFEHREHGLTGVADMNTAGKVSAGWRALIIVFVMSVAGCVVAGPQGEQP